MAENTDHLNLDYDSTQKVYDACPRCGHKLSPWQQVLLTVDRALVCKECWFRIILEISEYEEMHSPLKDSE